MGEAIVSPGARWEHLLGVQNESNAFVTDLLKQLESAQKKHAETEDNLQQALEEKKALYTRFRDAQVELKNLRKEMDSNSFFGSGGKAAVAALLSSVVSYVKGSLDLSHDPEVLVRVYCNVRGLSKTYINNGILDSKQDFELFVQGFNKAHPFCDFVDVGEGKERADNKIREMFRVHVKDVHCKHVFLGGSSDNGYARVLEPYAGDEVIKNRITMLEGPPFAAELSALVGKFRVTSFSEVFRSKKLGSASHSSLAGTPQLPGSTYAKTASSGTTVELEMAQKNPLGALKLPTGGILRNKQGQRVDKPIPPVSDNLFCLMRDAKLCNYYHLGSHCPLKRCEYIHEPRLFPAKMHNVDTNVVD
ncbi:MAG: hypothetical protein OHK93_007879 [Ramalina farinacea]|uniref:C3H1-type domain-containing protein n=1 Tax=Ramalina farinacea TaxID=258253 RepID=A0AA43QN19_9LECA|nr:hypothetical protein [Ramalina farinacea]